jgi:hypothetical protein
MADPIKIETKNTVDVLGLDDIDVDLTLGLPQPLRTEAKNEIDLKPLEADLDLDLDNHFRIDPLTTTSNVAVDLKPAVVDLCLTLNVGKLPNVCIKQPYHHHIGFTLWGTEVWGYTFSGEQETIIQEQHPHPRVALGGAQAGWSAPPAPPAPAQPVRETGGLRIRLDQ